MKKTDKQLWLSKWALLGYSEYLPMALFLTVPDVAFTRRPGGFYTWLRLPNGGALELGIQKTGRFFSVTVVDPAEDAGVDEHRLISQAVAYRTLVELLRVEYGVSWSPSEEG